MHTESARTLLNERDAAFVDTLVKLTHDDWSPLVLDAAYRMLRRYVAALKARGVDYVDIRQPIDEFVGRRALRKLRQDRWVEYSGGLIYVRMKVAADNAPLQGELARRVPHVWKKKAEDDEDPSIITWLAPAYRPETLEALSVFLTRHDFRSVEIVAEQHLEREKRRRASRAVDAVIDIPGLRSDADHKLMPFQRAGIAFAARAKRVYIADQMGLGKTIQALGFLEAVKAYPAVIVMPASLKATWEEKCREWLPQRKVQVIESGKDEIDPTAEIILVNYDLLKTEAFDPKTGLAVDDKARPTEDVPDVKGDVDVGEDDDPEPKKRKKRRRNYPRRLVSVAARIKKFALAALVCDEAHYAKNRTADRTRAVRGLAAGVEHVAFLSGTPVKSRPEEMIAQIEILGYLDTEFGGRFGFGFRYCKPTLGRGGWMLTGSENEDELRERMRSTFMIRRMKHEVFKELPAVMHSRVSLDIANKAEYDRADADFMRWLTETAGDEAAKKAKKAEAIARIGKLTQLAAKGKLERIIEWVRRFVEEGEKLVLFAHHKEIQESIVKAFPGAVAIRGGASANETKEAVDAFQTKKEVTLIVCSILAGSVGHTLTAASQIAFCELAWTPAEMDQAVGRIDRYGQTARKLNVYYLLARGTIEEEIERMLAKKRAITAAITDADEQRKVAAKSIGDDLFDTLLRGKPQPQLARAG